MQGQKLSTGLRVTLAIFAMTLFMAGAAAGQERVLYSFNNNGTDGTNPGSSLVFDTAGNIYGTTFNGGTFGGGTAFELKPKTGGGWTEKVLHDFGSGTDGQYPNGGLTLDASGNLYGVTNDGGTNRIGTVFELSPQAGGVWTESVLYNFDGSTGSNPSGNLLLDSSGNLYGASTTGGTYNYGTVYELTPAGGGTWTENVLHIFNNDGTDGFEPFAGLSLDASGNLYGTASDLSFAQGAVFELTPAGGGVWTEKILHTFVKDGVDGNDPFSSGVILDASGDLYGATFAGGATNNGTVYELIPGAAGKWKERILHNFTNDGKDGIYPESGLVFDSTGNLYGTTYGAFNSNYGTVYELKPKTGGGWMEKILHTFNNNGKDGLYPGASLIFDGTGNLYGTTHGGGAHASGTVFRITP